MFVSVNKTFFSRHIIQCIQEQTDQSKVVISVKEPKTSNRRKRRQILQDDSLLMNQNAASNLQHIFLRTSNFPNDWNIWSYGVNDTVEIQRDIQHNRERD